VVIALGGGTIAQPRSFALVRESRCVLIWLDCPIEELLARCAMINNRPLFRDEASFRALYEQRKPGYEQADYRVASTGDPRAVVAQLLALQIFEKVTA
jgi:shikimate kinase